MKTNMLVKFVISDCEEISKDIKYFEGLSSRERTMKVWTYKIKGDDKNMYYMFDEHAPRFGLWKGKTIYGNARKLENDKWTNWGEYQGAYKLEFTRYPVLMDAIDTPQKFSVAKKKEIERLQKLVEKTQQEIKRLENL